MSDGRRRGCLSSGLSEDSVRLLSTYLDLRTLCALLSTSRSLRAIVGFEIDLSQAASEHGSAGSGSAMESSMSAARAIDFVRRFGHRFIITSVVLHACDQRCFDALLAEAVGLRDVCVRAAERAAPIRSLEAARRAGALRSVRLLGSAGAGLTNIAPLAECSKLEKLTVNGVRTLTALHGAEELAMCGELRCLELRCLELHQSHTGDAADHLHRHIKRRLPDRQRSLAGENQGYCGIEMGAGNRL